jgi:hypothetical protein
MKITYRGIDYDYTPPAVETAETSEVGTYRGVDIRFRTVKKAPVQQPSLDLVYRGVAYRTGEAADYSAVAVAPCSARWIGRQSSRHAARPSPQCEAPSASHAGPSRQ